MKIAHFCEKAFNGGALASLKQIKLAIGIKRPQWEQDILVLCNKDPDKVAESSLFDNGSIYAKHDQVNKILHNYDVVFIHKLMNTNVGRMLSYVPRSRCKSAVLSHTFSVNPSNCLVGRPDICICVSDHMKKTFQKFNPKTNFTFIHNAVDSSWIKRKTGSDVEVREGVVGRSNALNLIKYSKKFTDWFCKSNFGKKLHMEYLGGGALVQEARSYAHAVEEFNSIDFKGNIEEERTRFSIMASWEIFLYDINLPEGTSMSILESLALGVPVICSNKPGNNEIIVDGKNGFLFRDLNHALEIVKDLYSSGSIVNLRSSCIKLAEENYNFNKMASAYVDLLEGLVSTKTKTNNNIHIVNNANVNFNKEKMHKNNEDFLVRGNRKVSFHGNAISKNSIAKEQHKKIIIDKKKLKEEHVKHNHQAKIDAVNKSRDIDRDKKKENKKIISINEKIKNKHKISIKPVATDAFIQDVFSKIEKSSKVFEGPKFTIITAAYNKGQYINDWANSIVDQKYRPLEVVFVNDCSSDNTEEKINEVEKTFNENGISFIYHSNDNTKGCAKSYSAALSKGTGDYFGVVDADDALLPDAVSVVMAKYLSNEKISFIWSQYIRCNHDMTMVGSGISRHVPQRPPKSMLDYESHIKRIHCYSHWRTMKRVPDMLSVFDCPYSSSVDKFMGYMLEELGHGYFLNVPLYKYRGSVSDGLTATTAQRNNWDKIRNDARKRRMRSRKKVYPIIL